MIANRNYPTGKQSRIHSMLIILFVLVPLFSYMSWAHPPSGIVVDQKNQIYFLLYGAQNRIMRIDQKGKVSPFLIDGRLHLPHHLTIDSLGNLYTVSDNDGIVWKISQEGRMTKIYPKEIQKNTLQIGRGGDPFTVDGEGNIYCLNGVKPILKITPDGKISPWAGGSTGLPNGKVSKTLIGDLHMSTMTFGPDGFFYVTERLVIRKVAQDGTVSSLRVLDGPKLGLGMGLAVDLKGNVYVADYGYKQILKITPEGKSTLLSEKKFSEPSGVATGQEGEIFVMDHTRDSTRVWKISLDRQVTLLASVPNNESSVK